MSIESASTFMTKYRWPIRVAAFVVGVLGTLLVQAVV